MRVWLVETVGAITPTTVLATLNSFASNYLLTMPWFWGLLISFLKKGADSGYEETMI